MNPTFTNIVTFVLIVSIHAAPVVARTWYIKADGTGDAPTIQAGVDSAASGDTVLTALGTYSDTTHVIVNGTLRAVNVHITKPIALLGEPTGDRPRIDQVNSYIGIFVDNVNSVVSIGHFSMRWIAFPEIPNSRAVAPGSEMLRGPAGILGQSSSLEIFDSDLSHQDDAIRLSHSTGDVYNCEIHTNTAAVALIDGSDVNIRDNVIFDGPFGVDCDHSSAHVTNNTFGAPPPAGQTVSVYSIDSSVDVRGNTMRWGDGGLSAIRSQVVFDGNHLSNMNGSGVYLGSSSALITNNIFYIGGYAVYSVSATTGEISNNTIDKYDVGMLSELGPTQLIRNNIISRGFWGIQCVNSLLTVECNDIFDMSSGPYDIGLCSVQPDESNFFTDPEYCGVDDSGNYFLQSDSPCAPGNHPDGYECGLIGALPVNCGKVDVEKKSWGSIKSMYKKDG